MYQSVSVLNISIPRKSFQSVAVGASVHVILLSCNTDGFVNALTLVQIRSELAQDLFVMKRLDPQK
jgi:hypothetical protein